MLPAPSPGGVGGKHLLVGKGGMAAVDGVSGWVPGASLSKERGWGGGIFLSPLLVPFTSSNIYYN